MLALKRDFLQPSEAIARTKVYALYGNLRCRSTVNSRESRLPEFSKFYCHFGRTVGALFWMNTPDLLAVTSV